MTTSPWYPVNLNIEGKKIIVFGGGNVAQRKVENILLCSGCVTVISPQLTLALKDLVKKGEIKYIQDSYKQQCIDGAYLVFAATSDKDVNKEIARIASEKNILVNVCHSADKSSFIVPAVFREKAVTVAVSTDGKSPAEAVRVRDKISATRIYFTV